ncbi:uncharacterized membrane protein At1g16860-like [Citrus sinensis]|uniref:uncharacterized membrane protein At1g16860-like n=1 Tax=Citrus sinensis TaxID=2711 RepID=UPI002279A555|nr:uncharacterized membrane protein At1g16860-like [Citrus sinensis]
MPFSSYLSKFPLYLPRLVPHGQLVKITGLASCGSVSLESSYEKATRCIYTSTLLHENRRLGLKPVNINKSCCQWSLAYCEVLQTFMLGVRWLDALRFVEIFLNFS